MNTALLLIVLAHLCAATLIDPQSILNHELRKLADRWGAGEETQTSELEHCFVRQTGQRAVVGRITQQFHNVRCLVDPAKRQLAVAVYVSHWDMRKPGWYERLVSVCHQLEGLGAHALQYEYHQTVVMDQNVPHDEEGWRMRCEWQNSRWACLRLPMVRVWNLALNVTDDAWQRALHWLADMMPTPRNRLGAGRGKTDL